MRHLVSMLIFACLALACTHAAAEGYGIGDARATPPGIHYVRTGGYWSHGQDEGFYRVVVIAGGVEHVAHRLYLQWLAIDRDNNAYKLTRTVDVKELNGQVGAHFDVSPHFNPDGPFKLTVTVTTRDNVKRKRSLTATADGRYTIK